MSIQMLSGRLAVTAHYKLYQESLKPDFNLRRIIAHVNLLSRIHESPDIVERSNPISSLDPWMMPQTGPAYEEEDYTDESELVVDDSSDSDSSDCSSDYNPFMDSECYTTEVGHAESCMEEYNNMQPCNRSCLGDGLQELSEDEWDEYDQEEAEYYALTRIPPHSDGDSLNIATQLTIEPAQSTPRTINIFRRLFRKKRGRCSLEKQQISASGEDKQTRSSCAIS